MHYANDNAVVKAIYDFTHGPQRGLFVGIVVALALVSLYFPVRDLYVAKRSSDILAKQVEIREQYNDDLQKSVDKLLSEEGIKDAASEDLGLVMPGEKRIEVQGLDDDSDPSSSQKSSNAKKASEVAKEIEEVGKDVPRGTSRRSTCCLGLTVSRARRSCPTANSARRGARNDKLQTP